MLSIIRATRRLRFDMKKIFVLPMLSVLALASCGDSSSIVYNVQRKLASFSEETSLISSVAADALNSYRLMSPVNYVNHLNLIGALSDDAYVSNNSSLISKNPTSVLKSMKESYTFDSSDDLNYASRLVTVVGTNLDVKDKDLVSTLTNDYQVKFLNGSDYTYENVNSFIRDNTLNGITIPEDQFKDVNVFSASILSYKANFDFKPTETTVTTTAEKEVAALQMTVSSSYVENDKYIYAEIPVLDETLKVLMPKENYEFNSADLLSNSEKTGAIVSLTVPEIHLESSMYDTPSQKYSLDLKGSMGKFVDTSAAKYGMILNLTKFDMDVNGILADSVSFTSTPIATEDKVELLINNDFYFALVDKNNTPMFVGHQSL